MLIDIMDFLIVIFVCMCFISHAKSDWGNKDSGQYHIQTDGSSERYFKYQTNSGQYRKEKRMNDGTVIGTDAWIDDIGYLRLNNYIADNDGYRILKSKTVFVGKNRAIKDAIQMTKENKQTSFKQMSPVFTTTTETPWKSSVIPSYSTEDHSQNQEYASSVPSQSTAPQSIQFYKSTELTQSQLRPSSNLGRTNGFSYYLPQQYHEEKDSNSLYRSGSFGYIDPFNIRRVIYYNASPNGFSHRLNNRYVGFNAKPYDP